MATSKAQRLINLTVGLLSSNAYLTAEKIRRDVQGYEECTSEESFLRMFERDKAELREAGVPIDQGDAFTHGNSIGYRISPERYHLPELELGPEQSALLAVAGELVRDADRGRDALTKLSAAGADPDAAAHVASARVDRPRELETAATLAEGIAAGKQVRFEHTPPGAAEAVRRTVEPWWTGSRSGRWYLVGYDLDRSAPRVFRLVRMATVTIGSAAVTQKAPDAAAVRAMLDDSIANVDPTVSAEVWVAEGRGAELRARAAGDATEREVDGQRGEVLTVAGTVGEIAALVAGYGADAGVVSPAELVDRVEAILAAAERRGGAGAPRG